MESKVFARIAFSILLVSARALLAAPNEIKVFTDELAGYGEHTLETHLNKASRSGPKADTQTTPLQVMPEYSYGIWRNWEFSLQIPLAAPQERIHAEGARVELQYVAPHDASVGYYWGLNVELARSSRVGEAQLSNLEVMPIVGLRADRWHVVANPAINRSLTGADRTTRFEPSAKIAYRTSGKNYLGVEYYLEAGPLRHWLPNDQRSETLYFAWDGKVGKSDINIGLGRGMTGASDRWVFKMIYEFSF